MLASFVRDGAALRDYIGRKTYSAWSHNATAVFKSIAGSRANIVIDQDRVEESEVVCFALVRAMVLADRAYRHIESANPAVEERIADMAAIASGFGVLLSNAALRFRASQQSNGSQWSRLEATCLSAREFAFLLAYQVHRRGQAVDSAETVDVVNALEPKQRRHFLFELKRLNAKKTRRGHVDATRSKLFEPKAQSHTAAGAVVGVTLGSGILLLPISIFASMPCALVLLLLSTFAGFRYRQFLCGNCDKRISKNTTVCRSCAGFVKRHL